MSAYTFYEIKSQKSKEFVKGLRKVSLVCENRPDMHCFLWLNERDEPAHFQMLFNEKLVEWFEGREDLITSRTNRHQFQTTKPGVHKGSRTIHTIQDDFILNEGLEIIQSATFPDNYDSIIRLIFA